MGCALVFCPGIVGGYVARVFGGFRCSFVSDCWFNGMVWGRKAITRGGYGLISLYFDGCSFSYMVMQTLEANGISFHYSIVRLAAWVLFGSTGNLKGRSFQELAAPRH